MTEQLNEPHIAAFLHSGDGYMYEQWVDLRRDNACNPRALILQDHHQAIVARLKAENSALQQRLNEADQRIDELRHVGLELSGTMAEYRQMPCKSLQDRMLATYDRYVKRLNPTL